MMYRIHERSELPKNDKRGDRVYWRGRLEGVDGSTVAHLVAVVFVSLLLTR